MISINQDLHKLILFFKHRLKKQILGQQSKSRLLIKFIQKIG